MTLFSFWRALRGALALGFVMWLAGCATPAHIQGTGSAFDRIGRFAVNLQPVAQSPYAAQGGFSWRDSRDTLQLDLSNPLGSVLARIHVTPQRAVLQRADGSSESAPSPDALLTQVWGHPMPVSGLRSWIQGRTTPNHPVQQVQRDPQGRLQAFQQDGWQVQLSDYDAQGPLRVRLSRHDDQGQWRLQLVMGRD
ncbi:outer membrane lipoprotein LolB [Castellaniella sp.]|uniref:outer membrane lipoprotein LolB n=1 Tax=Castellaniella sp. TaxID=1955812 RepID=UPI003C73CAB3